MASLENILDSVVNQQGETIDLVKHFSGKTVIIYVALDSDQDCKEYKSNIVDYYNKNHESKNFEIVLACWSADEETFKQTYEGMPWLAIPPNSLKKKMVSEN